MKKQKIIEVIKIAIRKNNSKVKKALKDANIVVPIDISNTELLQLIVKEIETGNGYLLYYLGEVITPILNGGEHFSNIAPLLLGSLISTGATFLGGLFGGNDNNSAYQQQQLDAKKQAEQAMLKKQMIIAASELEAKRIKTETELKKRKAKTIRTAIIISSIGIISIIGTVLTIKYAPLPIKTEVRL